MRRRQLGFLVAMGVGRTGKQADSDGVGVELRSLDEARACIGARRKPDQPRPVEKRGGIPCRWADLSAGCRLVLALLGRVVVHSTRTRR